MPIVLSFALTLFNMISIGATRVLVTLYALQLGAAPLTVGLLAATFALFPMLLSWQTGKLADRFGPRRPLTLGAAIGVGGLLLAYFAPSLPVIFLAAALSGLAMTFYNVSLQNLIGTLSSPANRARNYSNYAMVIAVANAAGPLLAGFSIDRWGHAPTFLLIAGLLVVPLILLAVWGNILPRGRPARAPASILHTLTNPQMRPILAASGIAQGGLELFQVYVPVYGFAQGMSASAIGAIIATCAAGGFLSRLLLTRMIAALGSEEKLLAYALFLGAVMFAIVPFFESALPIGVISFVFGFGLNSSQPICLMLLYSRSPEGRAGEAIGLRFALDNAARLASPVVFGVVASALGLGAVFWISSVLLGAGGMVTRADAARKHEQ